MLLPIVKLLSRIFSSVYTPTNTLWKWFLWHLSHSCTFSYLHVKCSLIISTDISIKHRRHVYHISICHNCKKICFWWQKLRFKSLDSAGTLSWTNKMSFNRGQNKVSRYDFPINHRRVDEGGFLNKVSMKRPGI